MNRQPNRNRTRAEAAPSRRVRGLALATFTVVGLAVAALLLWSPGRPGRALPVLRLDALEPSAAAGLRTLMADVERQPGSGAAWGRLGASLRTFGWHGPARECLAEAARLEPNEARWPYLQALSLQAEFAGTPLALLRRAVSLCGDVPEVARWRLARLLLEDGQWDAARGEAEQLLRARPEFTPARLVLAQLAQARGEAGTALPLAAACAGDPRTARSAWTLVAALQQRLGNGPAAEEAARKAATTPPDQRVVDPFESEAMEQRGDARSLSDRAQQLLIEGKPAEAAPLVARLAAAHPQFSETWLLQGRMFLLRRELAQAEQALRRHLEMDPDSVNGTFQLGMVLVEQRRFDEALAVFDRAIALKPDFGPAFFNRGLALARSGRRAGAVPAFREAIRQSPEFVDSYVLLADLLREAGERAAALELLRQAQVLRPADDRIRTLRERLGPP